MKKRDQHRPRQRDDTRQQPGEVTRRDRKERRQQASHEGKRQDYPQQVMV